MSAAAPDLLLRPWAESDAPALREAIDEDLDHLKPWLTWTLEEPVSLERTRARLREYVEQRQAGEAFRYAITPVDSTARILGGAHLACRAGPAAHDVGYWVRKSATHRGIAGAAVAALIVDAFEHRGVERLVVRCDVANQASVAFAAGLGFRQVGRAVRTYPDGSPRPVLELELDRTGYRDEWDTALRDLAGRVRIDPAGG